MHETAIMPSPVAAIRLRRWLPIIEAMAGAIRARIAPTPSSQARAAVEKYAVTGSVWVRIVAYPNETSVMTVSAVSSGTRGRRRCDFSWGPL